MQANTAYLRAMGLELWFKLGLSFHSSLLLHRFLTLMLFWVKKGRGTAQEVVLEQGSENTGWMGIVGALGEVVRWMRRRFRKKREEICWPQIPRAVRFGRLSLYCQPYSQLVTSSSTENWIKKKNLKQLKWLKNGTKQVSFSLHVADLSRHDIVS